MLRLSLRLGLVCALLLATVLSAAAPVWATSSTLRSASIFGDRVFYTGNFSAPERIDLYSVGPGGTPIEHSIGLPAGAVLAYAVAPGYVVFSWRADGQTVLYSASLAGGPAVRLNPGYANPEAGRGDLQFVIVGDLVVYAVEQERRDVALLFSVPVAGGMAPTRLSPVLPDIGSLAWQVRSVQVSADGQTVAMVLALPQDSSPRIYTVPIEGGFPLLLRAGAALASTDRRTFALTPDASRVIFLSLVEGATPPQQRLVSARLDGSGLQELGTAAQVAFQVAPAGSQVIWFGSADPFASSGALRSIPPAGGPTVELSAAAGRALIFSPDGTELYLAPVGGGMQRISITGGPAQSVLADGLVDLAGLQFSPDGSQAFFRATRTEPSTSAIYRYATLESAPAQMISDPINGAAFDFMPVGDRLIYTVIDADERVQLVSVAPDGGAGIPLAVPYAEGENRLQLIGATPTELVYGIVSPTSSSGQPHVFTRLMRVAANGAQPATAIPLPGQTTFTLYLPLAVQRVEALQSS